MLETLEQVFGDTARWSRPEGGYFVWLELPHEAEEVPGVTFVKGSDFGGAPNTVRLAFSYVSPDEIREGVRRLSGAVAESAGAGAAAPATRGYAA